MAQNKGRMAQEQRRCLSVFVLDETFWETRFLPPFLSSQKLPRLDVLAAVFQSPRLGSNSRLATSQGYLSLAVSTRLALRISRLVFRLGTRSAQWQGVYL